MTELQRFTRKFIKVFIFCLLTVATIIYFLLFSGCATVTRVPFNESPWRYSYTMEQQKELADFCIAERPYEVWLVPCK